MRQQDLIKALEPLVDSNTLSGVLLSLARLCNEKAEHIRDNWQDKALADEWDRQAKRIDSVAGRCAL